MRSLFHETKAISIVLVLLASMLSESVKACSCSQSMVGLPVKEMGLGIPDANYRAVDADMIFEGILIERTHDSLRRIRDYRMLFEVTDVYKGDCVDTIAVYTNQTEGGCGFKAKEGSYSIVFAEKDDDGTWFTYRPDCWQGASQAFLPRRFQWLRTFLISLAYKIDGQYSLKQKRHYWAPRNNNPLNEVQSVEYSILNGKLHGPWILYTRDGKVVESGLYRAGRRRGTWFYRKKIEKGQELVELDY